VATPLLTTGQCRRATGVAHDPTVGAAGGVNGEAITSHKSDVATSTTPSIFSATLIMANKISN